ncbi:MAG: hypothetical protein ACK52I_10240 [Pseudomonadota bacterium]
MRACRNFPCPRPATGPDASFALGIGECANISVAAVPAVGAALRGPAVVSAPAT